MRGRLTVLEHCTPVWGALCSAASRSYGIPLFRGVRQGEVCLKFLLLGGGQGGEVLPLEAAEQESSCDEVSAVRGVLPVGMRPMCFPSLLQTSITRWGR